MTAKNSQKQWNAWNYRQLPFSSRISSCRRYKICKYIFCVGEAVLTKGNFRRGGTSFSIHIIKHCKQLAALLLFFSIFLFFIKSNAKMTELRIGSSSVRYTQCIRVIWKKKMRNWALLRKRKNHVSQIVGNVDHHYLLKNQIVWILIYWKMLAFNFWQIQAQETSNILEKSSSLTRIFLATPLMFTLISLQHTKIICMVKKCRKLMVFSGNFSKYQVRTANFCRNHESTWILTLQVI